mgnify:CR=1 FL=1
MSLHRSVDVRLERCGARWLAVVLAGVVLLFGCSDSEGADPGGGGVAGTGGAAGHGGAGAGPSSCATSADSVTDNQITWSFDGDHCIGQYANGDWWVVGPVTITSIDPPIDYSVVDGPDDVCDGFTAGNEACAAACSSSAGADHSSTCTSDDRCVCARVRHGWQVNPVTPNGQGFDDRAGPFDGVLVPALPYQASADQSIVKTVSREVDDPAARPSLLRAAVLTVVADIPPDHGASVFRPPYVGDTKPEYAVADLRTDLLPALAPVDETPSLQAIVDRFRPLQLDHGAGAANRFLHPEEHMPDYGCDIGRDIGDGALRLMLDDSVEDKMAALVVFVQMGIDLYHAVLNGQTWSAGGGHQTGRKLGLCFTAVMLDDAAMKQTALESLFFEEDTGIYLGANAGIPLYGYTIFGGTEEAYWTRLVNEAGNKAHADPYEWIDGGWLDGGNYQGIVSPTWKGQALALHLMPQLRQVWDNPVFDNYADRWVHLGFWTQPDPCSPHDGNWANYGVTYGPDGQGGCILDTNSADGEGRFVASHLTGADGPNRRSAFQGHLWDAYRGVSCYDGTCEGDETSDTCPYDCGGL